MSIWAVLVIAAVGGFVYFATTYFALKREIATLPKVEQAAILIDQATEDRHKLPWRERLSVAAMQRGWDGNLAPLVLIGLIATFLVALAMSQLNVPPLLALPLAIPLVVGGMWVFDGYRASRRARLFNRQLVQVLDLLVAEIEAGNGPAQSLQRIPLSLSEPSRSEFFAASDRIQLGAHLDDAVRPIATKYPSRSMALILAALRIDRERGARIAPALRQAASSLRRDIELTEETMAEISQTKFEFGLITVIFGFIAASMIFTAGQQELFFGTALGLIGVTFAVANVALGVFRAFRLINRIQKVGG